LPGEFSLSVGEIIRGFDGFERSVVGGVGWKVGHGGRKVSIVACPPGEINLVGGANTEDSYVGAAIAFHVGGVAAESRRSSFKAGVWE
jgi:hypothetical protein